MKLLLPVLSALILSSCASIFNSKYCKTDIRTDTPMTVIVDSMAVELEPLSANVVTLARSGNPKEMILVQESGRDTISVKPVWSTAYYFNFPTLYIGFMGDASSAKKWKYPSTIRLSSQYIDEHRYIAQPLKIRRQYDRNRYASKGILNLRISMPYASLFYSDYGNDDRWSAGFIGFSLGLDYFYKDRVFLNVSGSGIMDFFIPFPAPVDYGGIRNHMASVYGSVSNNHMMPKKRFSLGYGISYGLDIWNTINHGHWGEDATEEEMEQESIYRKSRSLGLVFPFYYYTKHSFFIGLVYRPMFVRFAGNARFRYQHTASLDLGWRIRLKK